MITKIIKLFKPKAKPITIYHELVDENGRLQKLVSDLLHENYMLIKRMKELDK